VSGIDADDAPLRGTIVAEHKRCGKKNCRCARGHLHGPYYYRRWREWDGTQRKQYVPRDKVPQVRKALKENRTPSFRELLRMLRELGALTEEKTRKARKRMDKELGKYWHGTTLRNRRAFPAETRDRALYRASREKIVESLGWPITEDDFITLQGMIRSERKRRNRLGLPWKRYDVAAGGEVVALALNLSELPSYREHMARLQTQTAQEAEKDAEAKDKEEGLSEKSPIVEETQNEGSRSIERTAGERR